MRYITLTMTRRRFAFWLGFGLFSLADRLHINGLDALAAAAMGGDKPMPASGKPRPPEHWTAAGDETWRWYERENFFDGKWTLTGTTTPINKETGERKPSVGAYLHDSLLPAEMRPDVQQEIAQQGVGANTGKQSVVKHRRQLPIATRRERHGRPPSKWLRSLRTDEIRIWLKTIKVPDADVSGMTFWEHLTRDHSFDPKKIEGLTIAEQAKLHAAAHFGY